MLKKLKNQKAQALVEFLMLVPIVLTFLWYLIHVSSAINKSIVGQKHTRSQLFLKLFNHRSGPIQRDADGTSRSAFYIGVSDEVVDGTKEPMAPVERLGIGATPKKMEMADDSPGEANANIFRQSIRVRTVFGICSQRKLNPSGVGLTNFCGSESDGQGGGGGPVPVATPPSQSGV